MMSVSPETSVLGSIVTGCHPVREDEFTVPHHVRTILTYRRILTQPRHVTIKVQYQKLVISVADHEQHIKNVPRQTPVDQIARNRVKQIDLYHA